MGRRLSIVILVLCPTALVALFVYAFHGRDGEPLALLLAIPLILIARLAWRRARRNRVS